MSLPVRISEEADAELAEATRWYETQRTGLGVELLTSVDAAIARIEERPGVGSPIRGVSDQSVRRVFVRRFPYHLVYIELEDRLQVLAIAHDRRRPAFWISRLRQ